MTLKKTDSELTSMRQGGRKLGSILSSLLSMAHAGVTLGAIEKAAQHAIEKAGGTPSFQTVKGYRWATCLCVNDVVVHGPPTDYILNDGDVLTIDVGMLYEGLHTDTAWSISIGDPSTFVQTFLKTGEEALALAIGEARSGNRIGHISRIIQATVEKQGYSVVRSLVGHGIGQKLHDEPQVPGVLLSSLAATPELVAGMTIAIEVIYAMGRGAIEYKNADGWSLATKDGSLSAVFEHTVAIREHGEAEVLTRREK